MANYNKSFNFRNGVQVDTDKFIVNSAGLVGIGSTIPTNYLDVNGGIDVTGSITAGGSVHSSNLHSTGISTILGSVGIGTTNINSNAFTNNSTILNAGIVTAVKYYGDGSTLSNVRSISVVGWEVHQALGGSANSGVSTDAKVGIGTTLAINSYDLIVGQDPSTAGNNGISFKASTGKVKSTGDIEASTLTGNLTGNVIGNISHSSGISSFTTLKVGSATGFGVTLTATTSDFSSTINAEKLNVTSNTTFSGISTFSDDVIVGVGATVGIETNVYFGTNNKAIFNNNLQIFAGDDSVIRHTKTGAGNDLSIESDTTVYVGKTELSQTMAAFRSGESVDLYYNNTKEFSTVDGGVYVSNKVGIGTSVPSTDFELRKESGSASLEVVSDTNTALVSVGRTGLSKGQLRYGHTAGTYKYSDATSLDVISFSRGNINNILNSNLETGIGTGSFHWIVGDSGDPKMTLTYEGDLGIGATQPLNKLHVVGTSTFTGTLYAGADVEISGNINANGLTVDQITSNFKGDVLSPNGSVLLQNGISGGTNSYIGVGIVTGSSSINTPELKVTSGVGINTDVDDDRSLRVGVGSEQIYIDAANSCIGIKTDLDYAKFEQLAVVIPDHGVLVAGVGIGTTGILTPANGPANQKQLRAALDVGYGGTETTRFMIPPTVTTNQRDGTGGEVGLVPVAGALIYNSTTNKLNVYNGSAWRQVTDGAV